MSDGTVKRTPREDARVCLFALAILSLPVIISMFAIDTAPPKLLLTLNGPNPSPYGYTVSLLLFIVPALALFIWFVRHPSYAFNRKVFWTTIAILTPLGFILDFLFAETFFHFPNTGATLGIMIPVRGGAVPIEEFIFYLSGFVVTLLFYLWCNEYWCGAYRVLNPIEEARQFGVTKVMSFDFRPVIVGLVILGPAFIYEEFVAHDPEGFPGYMAFLLLSAILPSLVLYRSMKYFINWRAFSMTMAVLLLISLIWEATLAIPYGWWGYEESQMLGLTVYSWSNLPIEATLVWICVSFTTVLVYETVKLAYAIHNGKKDGSWPPAGG